MKPIRAMGWRVTKGMARRRTGQPSSRWDFPPSPPHVSVQSWERSRARPRARIQSSTFGMMRVYSAYHNGLGT